MSVEPQKSEEQIINDSEKSDDMEENSEEKSESITKSSETEPKRMNTPVETKDEVELEAHKETLPKEQKIETIS